MKILLLTCRGISIFLNLSIWILGIMCLIVAFFEKDLFFSFIMFCTFILGVMIFVEAIFSIFTYFTEHIDTYDLNDNIENGKSKYSNILLAIFETTSFLSAIHLCCVSHKLLFEYFLPIIFILLLSLLYDNNNGLKTNLTKYGK